VVAQQRRGVIMNSRFHKLPSKKYPRQTW